MDTAQPNPLGLMLIVVTSLAVLVYVFLRMAGVTGRHGRPPPPKGAPGDHLHPVREAVRAVIVAELEDRHEVLVLRARDGERVHRGGASAKSERHRWALVSVQQLSSLEELPRVDHRFSSVGRR